VSARRVVIDWVPPTLNQHLRRHWSEYRHARRLAFGYLKAFLRRAPEAWRTAGRVRVHVQMYRRRMMDQDGAVGACKPLFDALVELGWARDDSPAAMEQVVPEVIVDRHRPRTDITLQEAEQPSPTRPAGAYPDSCASRLKADISGIPALNTPEARPCSETNSPSTTSVAERPRAPSNARLKPSSKTSATRTQTRRPSAP